MQDLCPRILVCGNTSRRSCWCGCLLRFRFTIPRRSLCNWLGSRKLLSLFCDLLGIRLFTFKVPPSAHQCLTNEARNLQSKLIVSVIGRGLEHPGVSMDFILRKRVARRNEMVGSSSGLG